MINSPMSCLNCEMFREGMNEWYCNAFPKGIPNGYEIPYGTRYGDKVMCNNGIGYYPSEDIVARFEGYNPYKEAAE